jgi:hypothetical protein
MIAEVKIPDQEVIHAPLSENELLASTEEIVIPTPAEPIASITLTYTADEVNARFLKKELKADATSEENKSSGIQKLIGLAYDVKNDNNAFGDLRQKKNEILALNFRENKREENK